MSQLKQSVLRNMARDLCAVDPKECGRGKQNLANQVAESIAQRKVAKAGADLKKNKPKPKSKPKKN